MKPDEKADDLVVNAAAKADRHFAYALGRGLEVVVAAMAIACCNQVWHAPADAVSTVSRLTNTLTKLGYLVYVRTVPSTALASPPSLGVPCWRLDDSRIRAQELAEFGQCMVSGHPRSPVDAPSTRHAARPRSP